MMQIVDCDIHPLVRGGVQGLRPYLASRSDDVLDEVRYIATHSSRSRPINRYMNPSPGLVKGVFRPDAVPPTGEEPGTDANFVRKDLLDRWNIDAGLLIPLPYAAWTNPRGASAMMSAMNQYFTDEWLALDSRFRLLAGIFPLDPADAVSEIKKRANGKQVAGITMPLIGQLMGDPHYHPIYKAACDAGMTIVVHPSGAEGSYPIAPSLAGGLPATYAERHVGLSQVGAANVASLILSGTFDKFPALKITFTEYGFTWAAPLVWRMEKEYDRRGALNLKKRPKDYLIDNIRFTTQPLEEPTSALQLSKLIDMICGERTLLFSTDYPHWDNDNPHRILGSLTKDLRQRVFYDNAKETFAGRI